LDGNQIIEAQRQDSSTSTGRQPDDVRSAMAPTEVVRPSLPIGVKQRSSVAPERIGAVYLDALKAVAQPAGDA
jgi:hypothetical protein